MDKVIDVNEDSIILHRLGILDSKLECPNKKKDFINTNVATKNNSTKQAAAATTKKLQELKSKNDLETGDGWSGLSLSETSSSDDDENDDDDDDSDCLFERQSRLPSTSASVSTSSRKQLRRPAHRAVGGTKTGNGHGTYRHYRHRESSPLMMTGLSLSYLWKIFALISAALFLGFSMPFQQTLPFALLNGIEYSEHAGKLIPIYFAQSCALLVGSFIAAFTMLRFNPFAILLLVMLFFIAFCLRLLKFDALINTVNNASEMDFYSSELFFCTAQAFMAGIIGRGILLISPYWTGRYQRILFLAYAAIALAATSNFLIQQQPTTITAEKITGINFSDNISQKLVPQQHLIRYRRQQTDGNGKIMQNNSGNIEIGNMSGTSVPSFLQLDLDNHNEGTGVEHGVGGLDAISYNLNNPIESNVTNRENTNATQINSTSTTIKFVPENGVEEKPTGAPTFKTKTEENAFRRKEVEIKRKKEQEEEKLLKQHQQTTIATAAALTTTSTTTVRTTITTTTTRRDTSVAIGDQQQQQMSQTEAMMGNVFSKDQIRNGAANATSPNVLPLSPSPQNVLQPSNERHLRLLTSLQLLIFCLLLAPFVLGFCCCCMLDHPCCSSEYKQLPKLLSPASAHRETFSCQLLSFIIWILHFSLIIMFELTTIINHWREQQSTNLFFGYFSPMALFWLIVGNAQLILSIRPAIAFNTTFIHAIYFLLILSCSLLHFILPIKITSTFLLEGGITIMAFAANLPLLLYVWYCQHSKCTYKNASARFIFALASAKLCTAMAYFWWQGGDPPTQVVQVARQAFPSLPIPRTPSLALFVLGTLTLGYACFLLLLAKLRRVERQQQISQLSSALNGKSTTGANSTHKKASTRRTTAAMKKRTNKGQYLLLANNNGKSKTSNGAGNASKEFPAFNLSALDTSASENDDDDACVEMESICEECELHMVKMKKTTTGNTKKQWSNNFDTEASSVEDLV